MNLRIADYADSIALFEAFIPEKTRLSKQQKEDSIDLLLHGLKAVSEQLGNINANSYHEKRRLLHATLNILKPKLLGEKNTFILNQLLQSELLEKEVISCSDIPSKNNIHGTSIGLFKGDITTIEIDAIVNAANSYLLGCFQPLHGCIDNAIHSNAGVQLRDDCNLIMQQQQSTEPTGIAKITRAYNLPSKFVIHTVGPIVKGRLSNRNQEDLAKSYLNCLEICKEVSSIRSIAFCCISTGVFGYPPEQAAQTAYNVVCEWLSKNPNQLDIVVFNVFLDNDLKIYESLIATS